MTSATAMPAIAIEPAKSKTAISQEVSLLRISVKGTPKIAAATPFNETFIDQAKALGARFAKDLPIPGQPVRSYWLFEEAQESILRHLCVSLYGVESGKATRGLPEASKTRWRGRSGQGSGAKLISEFGDKIAGEQAAQTAPALAQASVDQPIVKTGNGWICPPGQRVIGAGNSLDSASMSILTSTLAAFILRHGEPSDYDAVLAVHAAISAIADVRKAKEAKGEA
jgi:hypothetical protein